MNLTIDIGNTRNKLAIFDQDKIVEIIISDEVNTESLKKITDKYTNINSVILSSVKASNSKLINYIKLNFAYFIELSDQTKIPIENLYETKETLGKDRLAAVVGANNIFPNTNVLVIDVGTAITFDFINSKAQYIGGTISPGLEMRFKALNHFTGKLPLLEKESNFLLVGKSTQEAIISGVQNGIIFEIDSYINQFKQEHENLKTILTGGDAIFFDTKLKNSIFVNLNLNFIGLNTILEYHITK